MLIQKQHHLWAYSKDDMYILSVYAEIHIHDTNSKTSKSSHWRLWEFDELIKTTREHTSIEPADAHLVQKKQQLFIFGHKDWKLQRPGHNLEYIYKSVHCHKKTHTCKRSFKEWKEKMKSSSQFFGGVCLVNRTVFVPCVQRSAAFTLSKRTQRMSRETVRTFSMLCLQGFDQD